MRQGRDQGGVRRGDGADTGDLEARPKDGVGAGGSGVRGGATGHSTANADAGGNGDLEDLTVLDATDPELGLTGIGDMPAQDWAADTGPTRSGEASSHGVDRRLSDNSRAPGGRKIDFEKSDRK